MGQCVYFIGASVRMSPSLHRPPLPPSSGENPVSAMAWPAALYHRLPVCHPDFPSPALPLLCGAGSLEGNRISEASLNGGSPWLISNHTAVLRSPGESRRPGRGEQPH